MADGAFGTLNAQQVETLELVMTKSSQLADLINDIVSVQESETRNLLPRSIHLERIVALAVRSSADRAQAKDIQIVARIPSGLPLVFADPVRIEEVFKELLENAIKFSPPSTQIEITLEDTGGMVIQACVRDHGIGIAPEEHEKIFRRFYQVDSGTTRRFGGTGLGLTIVRKVIEGHNGRVWLESTPGQGSSFYLALPKASAIG
jgi:signal transduction histidine kinase